MDRTSLRFQQIDFKGRDEPASPVEVGLGEVHVWGYVLDIGDSDLPRAASLLSRAEQEKADRMVSEMHRRHLMAAHVGLRVILGRYCGNRPQELVIHKTAAGKPFLPDVPPIRFNLTHSHGRALVAVAKDRDVGIDLEKVRQEVDVLSLAKRFLSMQEQGFIETGDPARRHERFFQAWVAREAVVKAEGRGISFPLHHDHVEVTADGKEGRLVLGNGTTEGAVRPVRFLSLEPGWVGAVAAEGTDWIIRYQGQAESRITSET